MSRVGIEELLDWSFHDAARSHEQAASINNIYVFIRNMDSSDLTDLKSSQYLFLTFRMNKFAAHLASQIA
jgi:hypothetical protein